MHEDGVEIFEANAFGAGDEGLLKLTGAAEDVCGEGEFFGEFADEGLLVLLAVLPVGDGSEAGTGGAGFVSEIVAGPGGVEGGPAGVGVLFDVGKDEGVAEEGASGFWDCGVEALALVVWGGDEVGGEFVDG